MPPKRARASTMTDEDIERMQDLNAALLEIVKGKKDEMNPSKVGASVARYKPAKYEGVGEPSLLGEWCREFDNIFELIACPEEMQVDQAVFYLRRKAGRWWTKNKATIREAFQLSEEPFVSWQNFKNILRNTFIPEHIRSKMRAHFDSFKMTDEMTVEDCHNIFMELAEYVADLNYNDEVLAMRFEKGLTLAIKKRLTAGVPTTVEEVYQRAGHAERIKEMVIEEKKEKGEKKRKSEAVSEGARGSKKANTNQLRVYTGNGTAFGGSASHGESRRAFSEPVQCFRCGKMGHKASTCRVVMNGQSREYGSQGGRWSN
ncbi:uncharacterized protein LOC141618676 [Silene latifolia]|uniref:uncharacterized protein LOC141618676 n=1 Tax=Silene latifolia TaxID=37657 RepID=UPI003D76B59D